jgi:hypothetical protein
MANEPEQKHNEDLKHYFGFPDAAYESDMSDLFLETAEFKGLKSGDSKAGNFVVVGVKGSGKTAICRHLSETRSSLLRLVDEQHRLVNVHAGKLGKYPQEVESVLLNWIFGILIQEIVTNPNRFSGAGVKLAKQLLPQMADYLKQLAKGVKLKGGVGVGPELELDFEKMFDATKFKFSEFRVDRYIEPLTKCFEQSPALLLFDDIDEIFMGADEKTYPTFIEGLIRAAKTINLKFQNRIHFLVFLKYGTFRSFFERPRDYEKVGSYITVLQWTEAELERVLAKRIAKRIGISEKRPTDEICSRVFKAETSSSIRQIRKFLFDRCQGPRDVITFCNKAVVAVGKPEIALDTLRKCETQFSEEKLIQIYEEYGYTYPDIHELIRLCFKGAKPEYDASPFRDFVANKVLAFDKAIARFAQEDYFANADTDEMILLLYRVGFIGYVLAKDDPPIFVLSHPGLEDLLEARSYFIHPAYRKYLHIT